MSVPALVLLLHFYWPFMLAVGLFGLVIGWLSVRPKGQGKG